MKATMLDKEQLRYIKRFKTLLNVGNINRNAELAMLSAYGVESCKDMSAYELLELCNKLDVQIKPDLAKLDKLRKNAIASIGGWLELTGKSEKGIEYIKAIACRSTEVDNFNRISESSMHSLIAEFNRKQKVTTKARSIKDEILNEVKITSTMN